MQNITFSEPQFTTSFWVNSEETCPYKETLLCVKNEVDNIDLSSPYEISCPTTPGMLGILHFPYNCYDASAHFFHAIREGDLEEIWDSIIHLLSSFLNLFCVPSSIIQGLFALSLIPVTGAIILTILIGASVGVLICIFEGGIEGISLLREIDFVKDFDFNFVIELEQLIQSSPSTESVKKILTILKENPKKYKKIFGTERFQKISELLTNIDTQSDNPCYYKKLLQDNTSQIKEIMCALMHDNLKKLHEQYTKLTPTEIEEICKKVKKQCNNNCSKKYKDQFIKQCQNQLQIKYKKLVRRVRDRVVQDIYRKVFSINEGLMHNDPEAFNEALSLVKDIQKQTIKKKIVHIIGLCALTASALVFFGIMAGFPPSIIFALFVTAFILICIRWSMHVMILDSKGWYINWSAMIPECIRKKFSTNALPYSQPDPLIMRIVLHSIPQESAAF